jgi:transcriptional regulator GlxA family with amidase domain
LKVQIVIFDGFDELDALGIFEPLSMAQFDIEIVSLQKQDTVFGANGLTVVPSGVLSIDSPPQLLCVPGGGWLKRSESGAWAEAERGEILEKLKEFHARKVILASVCTGTLLLGKAGLLKGRAAATNDEAVAELESLGANVKRCRVVDDGEIITAGGITASLDLGLWVIERFVGVEKSLQIAKQLHFERRGPVFCGQLKQPTLTA